MPARLTSGFDKILDWIVEALFWLGTTSLLMTSLCLIVSGIHEFLFPESWTLSFLASFIPPVILVGIAWMLGDKD